MNTEQLQLLLDAAQKLELDPSQLKVANPWTLSGPTAQSVQTAISELNPKQAAEWRQEAGETLSLAGAAAEAGLTPMSEATHNELMELSTEYQADWKQRRRLEEETIMRNMHHGMEEMRKHRERRLRFLGVKGDNKHSTGSTIASRLPTDHYREQN